MTYVTLDAERAVQASVQGKVSASEENSKAKAQDWRNGIEESALTPRYYLTISLIVLQEMFEFYDFFLVGYLVSVLVGKILGPLCLALIAGSNDLASPKATADAIAPAFLFLAACELAALIAIVTFRREPHGKPMDIG